MKTPEEIKKGLDCCAGDIHNCNKCPYCTPYIEKTPCMTRIKSDAYKYIQQLEERIQLMLIQMKGDCGVCKHRMDERKLADKQLGCRLSPACYECLKKDGREMWEYEGLPELARKESK